MKSRKVFVNRPLWLCILLLCVAVSCAHEQVEKEPEEPEQPVAEPDDCDSDKAALREKIARLEKALARREEQLAKLKDEMRDEVENVLAQRNKCKTKLELVEEQLGRLEEENEVLKRKVDEILGPDPAQPPTKQDIYVVQPGDTLESIAGKEEIYGDRTRWKEVYEENKDVIGEDPANLVPETKLIIPRS